jgi:putative phosphoesterase
MTKIGLLSDTHSFLDPKILSYFETCDEIWHAGDIGSIEVLDTLMQFKKFRIVYGNIDGHVIRSVVNETELFQIEEHKILMTHIAGPFGSYNPEIRSIIRKEKPTILVCGHSHILKVAYDQKNELLYINPGSCGKQGFQTVRTIIRFAIDGKELKNMEVIELQPRN